MDLDDLRAAYDRECREELRLHDPEARVERADPVVRAVGSTPAAEENGIVFSRLQESTADAVIRREIAYFRAQGRDFEWKHFDHDGPPDLAERLRRAGFAAGPEETLLVLEVGPSDLTRRTGPEIRRVGEEGLADVLDVQRAVWGRDLPWLQPALVREWRRAPDAMAFYAAYDGRLPVAAGWIRFGSAFATLHGGATRESHRGRGLYRALLDRRREDARARGVRWLVADASALSRPRLERMGFVVLGRTTPFVFRVGFPVSHGPSGSAQ